VPNDKQHDSPSTREDNRAIAFSRQFKKHSCHVQQQDTIICPPILEIVQQQITTILTPMKISAGCNPATSLKSPLFKVHLTLAVTEKSYFNKKSLQKYCSRFDKLEAMNLSLKIERKGR